MTEEETVVFSLNFKIRYTREIFITFLSIRIDDFSHAVPCRFSITKGRSELICTGILSSNSNWSISIFGGCLKYLVSFFFFFIINYQSILLYSIMQGSCKVLENLFFHESIIDNLLFTLYRFFFLDYLVDKRRNIFGKYVEVEKMEWNECINFLLFR